MSLAFRNEIDIKVWLSGSTIADLAILPRSRPPLTRLFAGKPVAALSSVLPRLFSLCSEMPPPSTDAACIMARTAVALAPSSASRPTNRPRSNSVRRSAMTAVIRRCTISGAASSPRADSTAARYAA